jgi:hypothetical protein
MHITRTIQIFCATILLTAGAAVPSAAAQARPLAVACSETALVTAVNTAQAAGGGVLTLTPNCTYNLTSARSTSLFHGRTGLPPITTTITFEGDGNVIRRSSSTAFRIIRVDTSGTLTLKGVEVADGRSTGLGAADDGGGILNFGALTLTASAVNDNSAAGDGGGIKSTGASAAVTLTDSTLSGNSASAFGGGLHSTGAATFTSSFVNGGNSATRGGGIASVNGTLTMTSTPVSANTAAVTAGGVYRQQGTMTLTTSPITGNSPNNCVGSTPAVPGCVA